MSDEVRRLLWPIQTEEEEIKHWEMFHKSRGKE